MRVIDKAVQMNEDFRPVMLVTLELPLTLMDDMDLDPHAFNRRLVEAMRQYDEEQREVSK